MSLKLMEFLRHWAIPQRPTVMSGYPARAVRGIFFSRPGAAPDTTPSSKAHSIVENWVLLERRLRGCEALGDVSKLRGCMFADLEGATGWSNKTILDLLKTPTAMGGLGHTAYVQYNGYGKRMIIESAVVPNKKLKVLLDAFPTIKDNIEMARLMLPPQAVKYHTKLQNIPLEGYRKLQLQSPIHAFTLHPADQYFNGQDLRFRIDLAERFRDRRWNLSDVQQLFMSRDAPILERVWLSTQRAVFKAWVMNDLPPPFNHNPFLDIHAYAVSHNQASWIMGVAMRWTVTSRRHQHISYGLVRRVSASIARFTEMHFKSKMLMLL